MTSVPRERVQQRTAEQIEDPPQSPEETKEAATLVPRERVQQRTTEQIEDPPQSPEETIEAVTLVPRERCCTRSPRTDVTASMVSSRD